MEPIPKSNLFYPSKAARIYITSLEEVIGKNGINAILNLANLPDLIDNYPANTVDRTFDFSDFSSINGALEEMFGPRGGRSLAMRAGRATFVEVLRNFGALAGVSEMAFKVLPLNAKIRIGLGNMANIFSQISDQTSSLEEMDDGFHYTIHNCPVCHGRHLEKPDCYVAVGLLQESLKWLSGGNEFNVEEIRCSGMGAEVCEFLILKEPIS
ncbi:MAG TPA: 4-vinyl reductase [Longilinea sp.]|jgi:predicted hydrocarbon binding protein|nr:4-vinyl reductase [Longilinea sp.]